MFQLGSILDMDLHRETERQTVKFTRQVPLNRPDCSNKFAASVTSLFYLPGCKILRQRLGNWKKLSFKFVRNILSSFDAL